MTMTKEQQEAVERPRKAMISDAMDLRDRLRGKYAIGPRLANGEPEFGYQIHTAMPDGKPFPDLYRQAADMIEAFLSLTEAPEAEAVEPVAWKLDHCEFGSDFYENEADVRSDHQLFGGVLTPLYTHPPTIQADLDRAVEALRDLLDTLRVARTAMFNLLLVAEVPDRFAASFNEVHLKISAAIAQAEGSLATITKGKP